MLKAMVCWALPADVIVTSPLLVLLVSGSVTVCPLSEMPSVTFLESTFHEKVLPAGMSAETMEYATVPFLKSHEALMSLLLNP
jgi:hypothetical protein